MDFISVFFHVFIYQTLKGKIRCKLWVSGAAWTREHIEPLGLPSLVFIPAATCLMCAVAPSLCLNHPPVEWHPLTNEEQLPVVSSKFYRKCKSVEVSTNPSNNLYIVDNIYLIIGVNYEIQKDNYPRLL